MIENWIIIINKDIIRIINIAAGAYATPIALEIYSRLSRQMESNKKFHQRKARAMSSLLSAFFYALNRQLRLKR